MSEFRHKVHPQSDPQSIPTPPISHPDLLSLDQCGTYSLQVAIERGLDHAGNVLTVLYVVDVLLTEILPTLLTDFRPPGPEHGTSTLTNPLTGAWARSTRIQ
jgi:hypothetical protein